MQQLNSGIAFKINALCNTLYTGIVLRYEVKEKLKLKRQMTNAGESRYFKRTSTAFSYIRREDTQPSV